MLSAVSVACVIVLVPSVCNLNLWCRILLQKLKGSELVKKLPDFYRTGSFMTVFTNILLYTLSSAN
jgi:hypothetical protein